MTGKVNLALLPSPKHPNSFICLFACLFVCLFLPQWCAGTFLLDFWASTKTLSSVRDYIKQPWISRAPRPWPRGAGSGSEATVVSVLGLLEVCMTITQCTSGWLLLFLSPLVYGSHNPQRGTFVYAAAAAESLHLCLTLCDPIEVSPPGSPVPGTLQARTLEWVAISFSNAWKWKVKGKLFSRVWLLVTSWTAAHGAPPSMGFSSKSTGVGCHCLLPFCIWMDAKLLLVRGEYKWRTSCLASLQVSRAIILDTSGSLLFWHSPYTSFWFNVCRGYCWLKLGPHILLGYLCLGPIILFLVWKIIPPPTVEAKRNLFPSKEVSGDAVSLA